MVEHIRKLHGMFAKFKARHMHLKNPKADKRPSGAEIARMRSQRSSRSRSGAIEAETGSNYSQNSFRESEVAEKEAQVARLLAEI